MLDTLGTSVLTHRSQTSHARQLVTCRGQVHMVMTYFTAYAHLTPRLLPDDLSTGNLCKCIEKLCSLEVFADHSPVDLYCMIRTGASKSNVRAFTALAGGSQHGPYNISYMSVQQRPKLHFE